MQRSLERNGTPTGHGLAPVDREAAMRLYPFRQSERHDVAAATSLSDIAWVKGAYGQAMASILGHELFELEHHDANLRRTRLYARHGAEALEMDAAGVDLPRDIQTGYLLATGGAHAADALAGLRTNIQRGINGVQIHRSGVTGIESNPVTAFLPSVLQINEVMHAYMTSVLQVAPHAGENEATMHQRLAQERRNAFALYKDVMEADQLQGLHKTDLHAILEVCFRLCNGQEPTFVLTTGYGGSEDEPSTRMPSYIAGACELMQIFQKHREAGNIRFLPTFRILNAYKIAGLVNQMDGDRIRASAGDMQQILRAFIARFLPELSAHVRFETDAALTYPTLDEAREYFAHLDTEDPRLGKIVSQAERMMKKERLVNRDDAVHRVQQYTAAHIVLFLDVIAPDWHAATPYAGHKPDVVWSIGGKGEQFFNDFRRMFSEDRKGPDHVHVSYHPLSIRTIQKVGQHPPYYQLPGLDTSARRVNGEPIVPDFSQVKDKAISKSVGTDYKALVGMVQRSLARERNCAPESVTETDAQAALKSFFMETARTGTPTVHV